MNDDTYGLDPNFERTVAALCCSEPRFWGRIGSDLDPNLFAQVAVKHAIEAAGLIAKATGRGPSSSVLVVQRLRRRLDEGKITMEQIRDVVEMLEDAADAGLPSIDDTVEELAPVLRQRAADEAVRLHMDTARTQGDTEDVVKAIRKSQRIGVVDTSYGVRLGPESFEEIQRLRRIKRLPTGITELDVVLDGGLARSGLGIVVGGAGDGKSMFLSHVASECVSSSLNCLYATLEIPEGEVLARVIANLTGIPINRLVEGDMTQAQRRLEQLPCGLFAVKEFTAYATSAGELNDWITECEDVEGVEFDAIFIDYLDRLGPGGHSNKSQSQYEVMRVVTQDLRQINVDRESFLWTASQATRGGKDRKRVDLNHMADSMHKGRIADLVVTLNVDDEGDDEEITFYVAKHRTGRSKVSVGPMPHEFFCGRVAPVSRIHGY